MPKYDTQITLEDAFAEYGKAFQEFIVALAAAAEARIQARRVIADAVQLQKDILLNK